jgi:hypothetical protein
MSGAILPLSNTPSLRGSQLKEAQGQILCFYITFIDGEHLHLAAHKSGMSSTQSVLPKDGARIVRIRNNE